ncbi:MAG TPA: hypothetical protein VGN51_02035 [Acidimicrobiia bacterium]|jgi:Tol biopolymer transport system component
MSELRHRLDEIAERGEPRGVDAVIAASTAEAERRIVTPLLAPSRRRTPALVMLAAVVVSALVVGVLVLRADDGDNRPRVNATSNPSMTTPPTTATTTAPPSTIFPPPSVDFSAVDFDHVAWIDGTALVTASSSDTTPRVVAQGQIERPQFSADGRWIAFVQDGSLHVRRAGGDGDIDLGSSVRPFQWSPTGELLGWSAGTDGYGQLRVTDPATNTTTSIPGAGDVTDFAWSHDGRSLAVARVVPGTATTGFEIVGADGSATRRVVFTPPAGDALGFNLLVFAGWQPDGAAVLVWVDPGGSASAMQDGLDLWLVPVDGSEPHLLGKTLLKREWLQWNADGSRLAIVRGTWRGVYDGARTVTVCRTDGDCTPISGDDVATMDPAWSPDGLQIAYVSKPATQPMPEVRNNKANWRALYAARTLWIANADGSDAHPVDAAGGGVASPRWTRDGARILYVRDDALWAVDLAGRTETNVLGPIAPVPQFQYGYRSNLAPPDAPYEAGSNNGYPTWESLVTWTP